MSLTIRSFTDATKTYEVFFDHGQQLACTCPAFKHSPVTGPPMCKHLKVLADLLAAQVKAARPLRAVS
jgi:hypothetical protein